MSPGTFREPRAFRGLLRCASLVLALTALRPLPAAADVEAILTADNAYGFGWGSNTTITAPNYYGPVINVNDSSGNYSNKTFMGCPAKNVTQSAPNNLDGVERFVIPTTQVPPPGGYFYVVTDSDDTTYQGVLGTFRNLLGNGQVIPTGHPDWEVCATGDNQLVGMSGSNFPGLPAINAKIQRCNQNVGTADPATSGGWVSATAGHPPSNTAASLGRLFPPNAADTFNGSTTSPSNGTAVKGSLNPYGSISCIASDAAWMWFNADAPGVNTNALNSSPVTLPGQAHHKEFLIFRLPVESVVDDECPIEVSQIGSTSCQPGLTGTGTSGCYQLTVRVKNNGAQKITHITLRPAVGSPVVVPMEILPGMTQTRIVTLCIPLSGVGTWVDVSAVGEAGGPCCSRRLNVELPRCAVDPCLNVPKAFSVSCDPNGLPGAFKVQLAVYTGAPGTLFALQPDDPSVKISPASYNLGAGGPFGPTFTVHDPNLAKSNPRRYCMKLNYLPPVSGTAPSGLNGECCTRTVCFEVPFCGLPTPTPEKIPFADADAAATPAAPNGDR